MPLAQFEPLFFALLFEGFFDFFVSAHSKQTIA